MASGNGTSATGTPPKLIGKLDDLRPATLRKAVEGFERQIVDAPVENAVIITKSGEVYHCSGDLNGINSIIELGGKLKGAIVTHNHPVGSDNEYSFSDDDLSLFRDFKLAVLRGVDERFVYELNRNSSEVDGIDLTLEDMLNAVEGTLARHMKVAEKALKYRIGYKRWSR